MNMPKWKSPQIADDSLKKKKKAKQNKKSNNKKEEQTKKMKKKKKANCSVSLGFLGVFFFSVRGQNKTTQKFEQTKKSAKFHILNSGEKKKKL